MNIPEWMNDPRIKNISPEKLALLLKLAQQLDGKTQKQAMPILMGAMASASRRRLTFTREEFDLIFRIMKEGKSEAEQKQMDETLSKAQQLMRGGKNTF